MAKSYSKLSTPPLDPLPQLHTECHNNGDNRDVDESRSPTDTLVPDFELQYDDKGDYEAIISERTENTFVGQDKSKLEISRLLPYDRPSGSSRGYLSLPIGNEPSIGRAEVAELAKESDRCQVYYIKHKNSHARLQIDRELLNKLIDSYKIFLRFWDQVFNFGPKTHQSDVAHAPFRYRRSQRSRGGRSHHLDECTYSLSYTERNNRNPDGNKDHEPWSVRQCAIYQQYDSFYDRVVFVVIAPSSKGQMRIERALENIENIEKRLNPFNLHRIFISTALENWRWYIRSLEDRMKVQTERVFLARVDNGDEKLSPLVNFPINFQDRQRLKVLEDRVLDLKIIFDSLLHTIECIKRQCSKAHKRDCEQCDSESCDFEGIGAEFEEQIQEVKVNQNKIETLQLRVQGTAGLLSDLLDYENTHALKVLAKESKELAEKNSKDAAAINIVIIITLIYLPITVVASVFSSQLIMVDDSGHVSVASGAWWFAATSVPLTVITLIAWRLWVIWAAWADTRRQNESKEAAAKLRKASVTEEMIDNNFFDPEEANARSEIPRKTCLNRICNKRSHLHGILC